MFYNNVDITKLINHKQVFSPLDNQKDGRETDSLGRETGFVSVMVDAVLEA